MLTASTAAGTMLEGGTVDRGNIIVAVTLPGVSADMTLTASDVQIAAQDTTSLPDPVSFATGARRMTATFTLSGAAAPAGPATTGTANSDGTYTLGGQYTPNSDGTFTVYGTTANSDGTFTLASGVSSGAIDAASLFRSYNTASPLYRKDARNAPVTIDVELYPPGAAGTPELVRPFTGVVDSYTVNVDGTVDFTCVDNSRLLSKLPAIAPVVTAAPWNAGLTSEFAMDAVLRAGSGGTVSSWPKQRPQCVFAVGFRASLWPDVGTLLSTWLQPVPVYATGAMGTALTSSPQTSVTPLTSDRWSLTGGVAGAAFVEFWAKADIATDINASVSISVLTDDLAEGLTIILVGGNLVIWDQKPGGVSASIAAPSDGLWHYYGVKATLPAVGGTAVSGTAYIDATPHAFSSTLGAARAVASWATATVGIDNLVVGAATVEALQVTTETAPTPNYPFTPRAVLDPSLNPLDIVPGIAAGSDVMDVTLAIAEAEGGLCGFGADGRFTFRNRRTLAAQPAARTVTSATSLMALTEEVLTGAVINRAHVGYTNWATGKAATMTSAAATAFAAQYAWHIPARATGRKAVVRLIRLDAPLVNVPTAFTLLPDNGVGSTGNNYFRSSLDRNGINADPNPPTITATALTSELIQITITNPDANDKFLVAASDHIAPPAGTPVLWLAGSPVVAEDEIIADYQYPAADDGGAASARFGEQLWEFTGSAWIQDSEAALSFGKDVVVDCCVPHTNFSGLGIMADPRVQLGDLLHVIDPDVTTVDEYVRVHGYALNLTDWTESIDARAIAAPGGWIGGVAGRSEGGVTTWGY